MNNGLSFTGTSWIHRKGLCKTYYFWVASKYIARERTGSVSLVMAYRIINFIKIVGRCLKNFQIDSIEKLLYPVTKKAFSIV